MDRKFAKDNIVMNTSSWHTIEGRFSAERYPGAQLADTIVDLEIPTFTISWENREKLMRELANVIEKYSI